MAFTGVHFILIIIGLDLIPAKTFLVETGGGRAGDYLRGPRPTWSTMDYLLNRRNGDSKVETNGDYNMETEEEASSSRDYKKEFDEFDVDGNGKITRKEIRKQIKPLLGADYSEVKEQRGEEWFKEDDLNGDGGIDYTEMVESQKKLTKEGFDEVDADGNGKITLKEMKKYRKDYVDSAKEIQDEFKETQDKNSDGAVDFEEWKK